MTNDVWQVGDDAFPALNGGALTADTRTEARLWAVQVLFAARRLGQPVSEIAAEWLAEVKQAKADKVLFAVLTNEAEDGAARYNQLIAAHTTDAWPLERMDPVHYALLWAACAELTARPETPAKVVMNEFINLAKGFSSQPDDVGYVNAMLEKMTVKVRGTLS